MTDRFHFGVVGRDISYSRSADIFRAAFKHSGRVISCDILSVEPDQLAAIIGRVRDGFYAGVSVTIPYKSEVIPWLDRLDLSAKRLNAVNSICNKEGEVWGYNTDVDGFAFPFERVNGLRKPATALVLGNGGVARAVVFSLSERLGCKRITVVGRSLSRLEAFREEVAGCLTGCELNIGLLDDPLSDSLLQCDLVVNGTPLGGPNAPDHTPLPSWLKFEKVGLYYDTNYNERNRLVVQARSAGVRAIDGTVMLVAQAIRSLGLWTGFEIEFDSTYNSVFGNR